jgi:endonuclease/exonuclease/phosphatase family metal-dependent hydrolase
MLRVATFNAGLAVGVLPHVTERLPHILAALAASDVDLLFVQEFWLDSHWEQLRRSLQPRLPHAFRPSPRAGRANGCAPGELGALRGCAERYCAGLRDEALARCVVRRCAPLALALSTQCLNCIASNPSGTLDEIFAGCTAAAAERSEMEAPPARQSHGGLMAYGGSFGTGLLLRCAPSATDTIAFRASLNARGALWARLETQDLGVLHVFAAHLSPGGLEQEPQVERLLAWIEQKAETDTALLLGDLNMTPSSPVFRRFEKAGFHPGSGSDRRGTFSSEGLLSGYFGESGWRLDHVLVRGGGLSVRTERFLDERVFLQTAEGARVSTLSDHAGLLSTVSRAE